MKYTEGNILYAHILISIHTYFLMAKSQFFLPIYSYIMSAGVSIHTCFSSVSVLQMPLMMLYLIT